MPSSKMKENIRFAIEQGYFGIDTAWVYQNEEVVGQAIEELKSENINVKIQTKIWTDFYDNPRKALSNQLNSLRTKSIYSLLLHRPSIDFKKSIHAWKELIKFKKENLVKHIGVSNFDKDMIDILIKETNVKPEMNQIEMSVTNFRDDRYHYNTKKNIEIQGWSPMGKDIHKILDNEYIKLLAKEFNVTPATIAISYLTSQNIVPVLASSSIEHIGEMKNLVDLSNEQINKIKSFNTYSNKFTETYP